MPNAGYFSQEDGHALEAEKHWKLQPLAWAQPEGSLWTADAGQHRPVIANPGQHGPPTTTAGQHLPREVRHTASQYAPSSHHDDLEQENERLAMQLQTLKGEHTHMKAAHKLQVLQLLDTAEELEVRVRETEERLATVVRQRDDMLRERSTLAAQLASAIQKRDSAMDERGATAARLEETAEASHAGDGPPKPCKRPCGGHGGHLGVDDVPPTQPRSEHSDTALAARSLAEELQDTGWDSSDSEHRARPVRVKSMLVSEADHRHQSTSVERELRDTHRALEMERRKNKILEKRMHELDVELEETRAAASEADRRKRQLAEKSVHLDPPDQRSADTMAALEASRGLNLRVLRRLRQQVPSRRVIYRPLSLHWEPPPAPPGSVSERRVTVCNMSSPGNALLEREVQDMAYMIAMPETRCRQGCVVVCGRAGGGGVLEAALRVLDAVVEAVFGVCKTMCQNRPAVAVAVDVAGEKDSGTTSTPARSGCVEVSSAAEARELIRTGRRACSDGRGGDEKRRGGCRATSVRLGCDGHVVTVIRMGRANQRRPSSWLYVVELACPDDAPGDEDKTRTQRSWDALASRIGQHGTDRLVCTDASGGGGRVDEEDYDQGIAGDRRSHIGDRGDDSGGGLLRILEPVLTGDSLVTVVATVGDPDDDFDGSDGKGRDQAVLDFVAQVLGYRDSRKSTDLVIDGI